MHARASLVLSLAALVAAVAAAPAAAKKVAAPTCSGQFAIAQSGTANVPASVLRLVSIDATGVTVATQCGTVVSRPKRTRHGWKFRAHWRPCDGAPKVVLAARVDGACTTLNGVLRTRKPHRTVKLGLRVAPVCGETSSFASTFDGIQSTIFEKHGCTDQACHGSVSKQGNLDLSPGVAYRNLLQVPSTASALPRVEPGDERRSFLWLKLAAATDPSQLPAHVDVPGAPMPNGLPPLSEDELELVRLWIYAGAPETGTVARTPTRCSARACRRRRRSPSSRSTAPAPGDGIQFVMPPWKLEAHSEHEICFATYYDITDQVPEEFQDPTRDLLPLLRPGAAAGPAEPSPHPQSLHRARATCTIPPSGAGPATAATGPGSSASRPIPPRAAAAASARAPIQQSFACIGFGPSDGGALAFAIGGAQKAQASVDYVAGVFAPDPDEGHPLLELARLQPDRRRHHHARAAQLLLRQEPAATRCSRSSTSARSSRADAAPYTTQTVCNDHDAAAGRAPLRAVVAHAQARQALHRRRRRTARCSTRASSTTTPSTSSSIHRWPSTRPIRRSARFTTARCTTTASPQTARPIRRR